MAVSLLKTILKVINNDYNYAKLYYYLQITSFQFIIVIKS